ncbi:MAG: mechanosensitive ion channel domain-containing protein [Elusimicrobiota bacterium]
MVQLIEKIAGLNPEIQGKILLSAVVLFAIWLLHGIVQRFSARRLKKLRHRYQFRKATNFIASLLSILIIARIWIQGFRHIGTFLGLLSAGLAIALKDPVANIAAWIFIIWRRPMEVGDRIQIADYAGDVIDIRMFQFTLLEIGNWVDADQSTGRIIHIPNGKVFTEMLANYSKGFQYIWNEIPVLVTFESNWEKAKAILKKIASEHAEQLTESAADKVKRAARKYFIFYSTLTPTVYTTVKDSGVMLTVRYLCEPRNRRGSSQAIWEDILHEFAAHPDIDFAYQTQRFYSSPLDKGQPKSDTMSQNEEKDT